MTARIARMQSIHLTDTQGVTMKKILMFLLASTAFVSLAANATANLAIGKIQAVKILDRSGSQYVQVIFATDAFVYNSNCDETYGGNNVAVAYISYGSHTSSIVNMWVSALMSAYETGTVVRITSAGGTDPCEADLVALETTNI